MEILLRMLTARMANKRNENKQTLSAETDHALSSGSAGGKKQPNNGPKSSHVSKGLALAHYKIAKVKTPFSIRGRVKGVETSMPEIHFEAQKKF